jgi:hypothetical protein
MVTTSLGVKCRDCDDKQCAKREGQQLNGLSQANSYGDDAQMATNFPLVRIETGGQVYYCRTHGFSTMAVATGSATVSTQVDVPPGIPLGPAQLVVIANGIASTPAAVNVVAGPGPVTALARTPSHMDVFWVAPDGSVRTNWWDAVVNNGLWNTPFEIAPAGSAEA